MTSREGEVHLYDPKTGAELERRNEGYGVGETWGPEGLRFSALHNANAERGEPYAETNGCGAFSYNGD